MNVFSRAKLVGPSTCRIGSTHAVAHTVACNNTQDNMPHNTPPRMKVAADFHNNGKSLNVDQSVYGNISTRCERGLSQAAIAKLLMMLMMMVVVVLVVVVVLICFLKSRHSCLIRPPALCLDLQRSLRFTRFRFYALFTLKLLGQFSCYIAP